MHRFYPPQDRIQRLAAAFLFAAVFLFTDQSGANADSPPLMAPAPEMIPAPPIELSKMDGSDFSLAARRGKFTLVNFWALWCAPCKKEMPDLARLKQRMTIRGLDVVAVNLGDKPDAVDRFLKQVGAEELTVVLDDRGETGRAWHVQGLPVTFLVSPDGRISHAALGAREWASKKAVRWLESEFSATRD